eukprot:6200137-Pleurochrysis_carterae.AAC.1
MESRVVLTCARDGPGTRENADFPHAHNMLSYSHTQMHSKTVCTFRCVHAYARIVCEVDFPYTHAHRRAREIASTRARALASAHWTR